MGYYFFKMKLSGDVTNKKGGISKLISRLVLYCAAVNQYPSRNKFSLLDGH
jgi:hypothetical protein